MKTENRTLISAHVISASVLVAAAMKVALDGGDSDTAAILMTAANVLLDVQRANLIAVERERSSQ